MTPGGSGAAAAVAEVKKTLDALDEQIRQELLRAAELRRELAAARGRTEKLAAEAEQERRKAREVAAEEEDLRALLKCLEAQKRDAYDAKGRLKVSL